MSLTPEQTDRVLALVRDFAREGDVAQLAEFLDHGIPVDLRDDDGNTLLMLAAYHGRLEGVRLLLDRGADPNLRNHRDQTPVAGALFKGEDQVVQLLKESGADLDAGTPSGRQAAEMFGRDL